MPAFSIDMTICSSGVPGQWSTSVASGPRAGSGWVCHVLPRSSLVLNDDRPDAYTVPFVRVVTVT